MYLSETAFLVQSGDHYELRWFTPSVEVDLCGHAKLASALAIFKHINPQACQPPAKIDEILGCNFLHHFHHPEIMIPAQDFHITS